MERRRPRRAVARLIVAMCLGAASLAAPSVAVAGDPCYQGFDIPRVSDEATNQVKLAPCAFLPTIARVDPGATVSFFNGPEFTHLITGAGQAWGDRDAEVGPGRTISYRFDAEGIYPYSCALHRGMTGAVVVGDGVSDGVAAAPVEDGDVAPGAAAAGIGDGAIIGAGALAILLALSAIVGYRGRRRRVVAEGTPVA